MVKKMPSLQPCAEVFSANFYILLYAIVLFV